MSAFQSSICCIVLLTLITSANADPDEINTNTRNCSETCNFRYRCNPYYDDPVWSLVNGTTCMIFKNGCIFSNENCQRENSCLKPMIPTDKSTCKQYCGKYCCVSKAPVCGVFASIAPDGTNTDVKINFDNKCELDKYACVNEKAIYYFSTGVC